MKYILFASPHWLWLLLLLPLLGYYLRRRQRALYWVPCLALGLCILAASRPWWQDRNGTMPELLLHNHDVSVETLPEMYQSWPRQSYMENAAAALRVAASQMPSGGTIVFATAPVDVDRSLDAALELAAKQGIRVVVADVGERISGIQLCEIDYPVVAGAGAEVALRLVLDHEDSTGVTAQLHDSEGRLLLDEQWHSSPGMTEKTLHFSAPSPGPFTGKLFLNAKFASDIAMEIRPPFRALLYSTDPTRELPLMGKMFASAIHVEAATATTNPSDYPLILLGESATSLLNGQIRTQIEEAVQAGSGLFAICGRDNLFSREDQDSEFAQLFPVQSSGEQENKLPTVALVVLIDTSGSMRGPRIDLARETARLALENLQENDMAGIVEFHGARRWAAPLQSAGNQFSLMRALNRLNAGGGTVILPAMSEAYYALRNAPTRLKHLLILTDGGVEYGDFESLIRKMVQHDITVSTVLVGPGQSDFLSRLALWGNGRFFRTSSRFALPDLQFRPPNPETLPPYRTGTFPVKPAPHALTADLPLDTTVSGIIKSQALPEADVLLQADGLPLLSVIQRGLGSVAVWSSEAAGEWTQMLNTRPEYPAMMTALARVLPDRSRFSGVAIRNRSVNRALAVDIETAADIDTLRLTLSMPDHDDTFQLRAVAPHTFHLRLPEVAEGIYRMNLPDYNLNFPLVSRRSGVGSSISRQSELERINALAVAPITDTTERAFPLDRYFALAGLGLFLLQLGLRRTSAFAAILLFCGVNAFGTISEYEQKLLQGMDWESRGKTLQAQEAFQSGIILAQDENDADFARILEWETARRNGTLPRLLDAALAQTTLSPLQRKLVANELEDRGDYLKALSVASAGEMVDANQIQRLAERAGIPVENPSFAVQLRAALLRGDRASAEAFYAKELAKTTDAERLQELAADAARHAFPELAKTALLQAAGTPENRNWPALFQLAKLQRDHGEPALAIESMRNWSQEAGVTNAVLLAFGDLSEQFGDYAAAGAFYQRLISDPKNIGDATRDEAGMRYATLLELSGKPEEAAAVWMQLLEKSDNEMRKKQAIERLVELHQKGGTLGDLCAKLAADRPVVNQDLYIRAMAAQGDFNALFAVLEQLNRQELKLPYALEQKKYDEAIKLLRSEIEQAPERRESCYRQLAMLAIETSDSKLAEEALNFLASNTTSGGYEFSGAVYSLCGDHKRAAESYQAAVAANIEKTELLLLWGKELEALGRGDEARDFFLKRLLEEPDAERFGVLVDGLLNLRADTAKLETAAAEVQRRLAAEPDHLFYYQLAEDLAEEAGDLAQIRRLERQQIAIAPERRGLLLQKLFLDAYQRQDVAESLYFGRLLLLLQESCNPEIYRTFADVLVGEQLYTEAERCMREADTAEETTSHLFALANLFATHYRFADAERIYRELLSLTPEDLDLMEQYAAMLEFQGEYRKAAEVNFVALNTLCRTQLEGGENSVRGSGKALFARKFAKLLSPFVNQAILYSDEFLPQIEACRDHAPNEAQKKSYQSILDRIAKLHGTLPQTVTDRDRKRTAERTLTAADLIASCRNLPDNEAAQKAEQFFSELPSARRGRYLSQILEVIDFEPGDALSATLRQHIGDLSDNQFSFSDWRLPYAAAIKTECAETMLAAAPESLNAMATAARMRHLNGDGEEARMIAELLYDELEHQKEITIPDITMLNKLQVLYTDAPGETPGAGKEALTNYLQSYFEKLRHGATIQQLVIAGALCHFNGNYDDAQQLLSIAWDANRNDHAVLWGLLAAVRTTGKWDAWTELALQKIPGDQTTALFYSVQLVPYLRETGRFEDAKGLISLLPSRVQQRERLLLAKKSNNHQQLAAEFMAFLYQERAESGTYSLWEPNNYWGGLLGDQASRNRNEALLFPALAAEVPECRPYLEYLLQGMAPDDRAFSLLYKTLQSMPQTTSPSSSAGQTLGGLLLQTLSDPKALSVAGKERLVKTAEEGLLPLACTLDIIALCPPSEAAALAEKTADAAIPSSGFLPDTEALIKVMNHLSPEAQALICQKLQAMQIFRDDIELERARLLKRFAPGQNSLAATSAGSSPSSTLTLLDRQKDGKIAWRNYLLTANDAPDWSMLLELTDDSAKLVREFAELAEELCANGTLSHADMVRNYSQLSIFDAPLRRAQHLEAAKRHHIQRDASSLWLLDALRINDDHAGYTELKAQLEADGRLNAFRPAIQK